MRGYDLRMHDGETRGRGLRPGHDNRQTHRVIYALRESAGPPRPQRRRPRTSIHMIRTDRTTSTTRDAQATGSPGPPHHAPHIRIIRHAAAARGDAPEMRPIRRDATGCTPLCTQAMAAAHTHSPNDSTVNHTYTHRGPQTAPAGEATGPKVSSKRQRVSQP